MRRILQVGLCVCFISGITSADLIRGIDIDFITIGNPGNQGDTRNDYPYSANPYNCGTVDYEYRIGNYEVTNAQWNTFVAAAGAPTGNETASYNSIAWWTGANVPTNNVSWHEAAQFCNYLTSGDKSRGAYLFSGNNTNPGDFLGIDRESAVTNYGVIYVLPTENEWYKAAYYKPSGNGYSTYANGTDVSPIADFDTNYGDSTSQPWNVGTGIEEQNGTYDIMGNVWEWNETLSDNMSGYRGGAYDNSGFGLRSSNRSIYYSSTESLNWGFRVASVPEPATILLLGLGGICLRRGRLMSL